MPTTSGRRRGLAAFVLAAFVLAAFVLAGLLAAACGSTTDPVGLSVAAVAGAYALTSVAGDAMPAAVTGTSTITVALQVTRRLNPDGTCRDSGTFATYWGHGPPGPDTTSGTVMTCTWTVSGRTITFRTSGEWLPYSGYDATTTATVAADGTLTERSTSPVNGFYLYPRIYRR